MYIYIYNNIKTSRFLRPMIHHEDVITNCLFSWLLHVVAPHFHFMVAKVDGRVGRVPLHAYEQATFLVILRKIDRFRMRTNTTSLLEFHIFIFDIIAGRSFLHPVLVRSEMSIYLMDLMVLLRLGPVHSAASDDTALLFWHVFVVSDDKS